MATSETTNLQLVKYGAGTDNFIRTDYNGNLDKIDTFAGNTNEAIASLNSNINTTYRDIYGTGSVNNCNDAEIGKWYHIYPSASNVPIANTGILFTYGNIADKHQICESASRYFVRRYTNDAWTNWVELALKSELSTYISIERDNVSLAQNGNTGWIAWASDDKFCFPVIEQGTYNSSAVGINVDTLNKKWRIINTYSGTQTITYSVIHFKSL